MLSERFVVPMLLSALMLSLMFRLVLWRYYRDGARILPLLKLAAPSDRKIVYYKRFDTLLAPLPFLYCWLEIVAAMLFFRWTGYAISAGILLVVVAAGRMRALQEIGHNALHCALCPSKAYQWGLSNVFFQFPTMKRDMHSRFITHVKEHHPNADVPGKDPNLKRVVAAGMVPGITSAGFIWGLCAPITPRGIVSAIKGNVHDTRTQNAHAGIVLLRIVSVSAVLALYLLMGGVQALIVGWLIPVVAIYPLFSWWSLLTKHRWHAPNELTSTDRRSHDYTHGRATEFPGVLGSVQRYLIYPMSDAYHLAHHIYPFVRSEYMPAVDHALKVQEPRYTQYIARGMFWSRGGQPAALSELYQRLVTASVPARS